MASRREQSDVGLDPSVAGRLTEVLALKPEIGGPRWAAVEAPPDLPSQHVERPSGLVVPRGYAVTRGPIDLFKVYVTDQEVLGVRLGLDRAAAALQRISLTAALRFATQWICRLQTFGADQQALDRSFAAASFRGEARVRADDLLDRGHHILVPQVLLVLLKLALFRCPEDRTDDESAEYLPAVMLSIAGALGAFEETGQRSEALEAEVIANQHFNSNHDLTNTMALFEHRWTRPDETGSALEDAYLEATGVSLRDVAVVALALWTAVQNGSSRVRKDYFRSLELSTERVEAALGLISATTATLKKEIYSSDEAEDWDAIGWVFSPLERFPVLRWEDDYVVISPRFLQERVFGWPAAFDMEHALRTRDRPGDADRAIGRLRGMTEGYTRNVLESIASSQPGLARRVYHEDALATAFGSRTKTADAAVDYGDAWAVVEISTRRLARPAVYARQGAMEHEIEVLVAKCVQLDATVKQLRSNEARLTGHLPIIPKRFYPILVLTEGYAVNPLVNLRLRQVLRMKHLLSGRDTDIVEVIDLQTLELVESMAEAGGPSLIELIDAKRRSAMANAGLWDYVVVEREYTGERSARLQKSWTAPFDWAIGALRPEPPQV